MIPACAHDQRQRGNGRRFHSAGARLAVLLGAGLLAAGCRQAAEGPQSMLAPAGPFAADIATLWWWMAVGATLVLLLVMVLVLLAFVPGERRRRDWRWMIPVGGVGLPLLLLPPLLVFGSRVGEAQWPRDGAALRVEVTGHRWWWEVRYPDLPARRSDIGVLHIPAGQPVDLVLGSSDVIHSFWVPRLAGKLDAIPGRRNVLRIVAREPGEYAGQCAEFCGTGHAHMQVRVRALDAGEWQRWLSAADAGGGP